MNSNKKLIGYTTRVLVFSALLIALDIIFTRFLRYEVYPYERLSLQFVSHAMSGILFGPIIAAINCIAGDLLGMVANSGGLSLNPLITGVAAMRGLLYGLLLKGGSKSFWRFLLAIGVVTVVCDLAANSFIMSGFFNIPAHTVFLTKLPVRLIATPLYALLMFALWRQLDKTRVFDGLTKRK